MNLKKKLEQFDYSGIEWRPRSYLVLRKEQKEKIVEILNSLEELEEVQSVYTNVNLNS